MDMAKGTGRSHVPENLLNPFLLPRIPNTWHSLSALSWPGGSHHTPSTLGVVWLPKVWVWGV